MRDAKSNYMKRRSYLAISLGATVVATGCLSNGDDEDSTDETSRIVRPETDPDPVPELECEDDDVIRYEPAYETPSWGEDGSFLIQIGSSSYTYGDIAEITLTNVTEDPADVQSYEQFSLEVYTDTGWQDVRVRTEETPVAFPDDGVTHDSGEDHRWELELTEEGIAAASFLSEETDVCPELRAGRYRFVFVNPFGDQQAELAVAFDLKQ